MEELVKILELLEEDSGNERSAVLIQDYIVPILQSIVSEITNTQQAVQTVAEVSQLAILTAQRTYVGEILRQLSDNFAIVLASADIPKEGPAAEALEEIDRLLGAWIEAEHGDFDYQNLDEDEDEDEDEEDDDEDEDDEDDDGDDESGEDDDGEDDKDGIEETKQTDTAGGAQ